MFREGGVQVCGQFGRAAKVCLNLGKRLAGVQPALQVAGQVVHHPQLGLAVQPQAALNGVDILFDGVHRASSSPQIWFTQAANSCQAAFSPARAARPASVMV